MVAMSEESQKNIWVLTDYSNSTWVLKATVELVLDDCQIFTTIVLQERMSYFFIIANHYCIYNLENGSWGMLDLADTL